MEGATSSNQIFFILGQILLGFGAAPLLTLGTTFLDESVGAKSSSWYIGIFNTGLIIGPAIGFVLGSQLLHFHTNFLTDSGITSASTLWVGAWWPGFLISSTMAVICSLCIGCFPKSINKTKMTSFIIASKNPDNMETENLDSKEKNSIFGNLTDEIFCLLKNATFVSLSLAISMDAMIISGTELLTDFLW